MCNIKSKNITKETKKILSEFFDLPLNKIKFGSLLTDDLGLDSFAAVELIYILEKKFDIQIPKNKNILLKINKVEDLVSHLKSYFE